MPDNVNLLDQLSLATPCGVHWDDMSGDDRARVCDKCKLRVYNLTGMIPQEAEQFLTAKEGAGCNRIYRRVDGSILTRDCPRGIRRARLATLAVISIAGLILFAMEQYGDYVRIRNTETYDMTSLEPFVRFRPAAASVYGATPGMAPYVFGQTGGSIPGRHRPYVVQPNPSSGYPALPSAMSTFSASRYMSLSNAKSKYNFSKSTMQQQLAEAVRQVTQKYPGAYGPAPATQPSEDDPELQTYEAQENLLEQIVAGDGVAPQPAGPATTQSWQKGDNLVP